MSAVTSQMLLSLGLAFFCVVGNARPAGHGLTPKQVTTPHRPAKSLFQSEPGKPHALQIAFDPQTQRVTVTLSVEDPDGYFIPNLRPENFAVYEDGILQKGATVDVEHAAVSMSVLLEGGGRYQELNQLLSTEIPFVARPLLSSLIPDDKVAVLSYAHTVKLLADVDQSRSRLDLLFTQLQISGFSEANLYDALVETLNRTRSMPGRKALLLISTGLDSFSHATFDDVVANAERADTPVYCIGLGGLVQRTLAVGSTSPLSKIDWSRASNQLKKLAGVTNGRTYLRDTALDVSAIYDDLMEHLRVRYVIKYTSGLAGGGGIMRKVRVTLVDPRTGGPPRITDAAGKAITARVSADASYTP
jgi:Ca-activated chloride channel family protein